jgi:hypothetical protein
VGEACARLACNLTCPSTRTPNGVRFLRSRLVLVAGYVYVRPHVSARLSWPVRIVSSLAVVGLMYAVAEDVFPSLRFGPPNTVVRECEQFNRGMEVSKARELAHAKHFRVTGTSESARVRVGGSCSCVLGTADGRIQENLVACEHTSRVLFSGAK